MAKQPSHSLRYILAENVRNFRIAEGYSQEKLAELSGLHRTYIGSIERQERNVTLTTLETLASTLGVSVVHLLSPGAGHACSDDESKA
ncbi:helix-turn-helix transcriptional regulator [Nitrosospira sp. Is2]|uniref:helix-turn-helix domain-containing protein n=1 Tax=Nitrosospira sp. Is2 TaxID=3080532 RepID=UPI002955477D|nr:helix-turn-helix transcriptional regulator [Nitrosospira sp. Is2]WON72493.1 helix-turn-helix transcriptional regulator [Nitrosospira sp. Is2]